MNVTEETFNPPAVPICDRVRVAVSRRGNWIQLLKFLCVGGTGYALNLLVFTLLAVVFDVNHLLAATVAFIVAVLNNFWLNRHWTFGAADGHAGFQAARFFAVSVVAFLFSLGVLELLVSVAGGAEGLAPGISA